FSDSTVASQCRIASETSYTVSFFFQAEDGIRDLYVTGVKTCALPISLLLSLVNDALARRLASSASLTSESSRVPAWWIFWRSSRSEERRVGKECRCGLGGDDRRRECSV